MNSVHRCSGESGSRPRLHAKPVASDGPTWRSVDSRTSSRPWVGIFGIPEP